MDIKVLVGVLGVIFTLYFLLIHRYEHVRNTYVLLDIPRDGELTTYKKNSVASWIATQHGYAKKWSDRDIVVFRRGIFSKWEVCSKI